MKRGKEKEKKKKERRKGRRGHPARVAKTTGLAVRSSSPFASNETNLLSYPPAIFENSIFNPQQTVILLNRG